VKINSGFPQFSNFIIFGFSIYAFHEISLIASLRICVLGKIYVVCHDFNTAAKNIVVLTKSYKNKTVKMKDEQLYSNAKIKKCIHVRRSSIFC